MSETRPSSVVIPRGTTVIHVGPKVPPPPPAPAPPPPRLCSYERTVRGRSPGSSLAALNSTTVEDCTEACCKRDGCLAIHLDSIHCYLLDRRWEGNFVNDTSGVCADRADVPPPPPPTPPPPPVTGVVLVGLRFAHTDFAAVGYQQGFSIMPTSPGMPRDAAVVVEAGVNITISQCSFLHLGGGGVHITKASKHVTVQSSYFDHLGQSGVSLVRYRIRPSYSILRLCLLRLFRLLLLCCSVSLAFDSLLRVTYTCIVGT